MCQDRVCALEFISHTLSVNNQFVTHDYLIVIVHVKGIFIQCHYQSGIVGAK